MSVCARACVVGFGRDPCNARAVQLQSAGANAPCVRVLVARDLRPCSAFQQAVQRGLKSCVVSLKKCNNL